MSRYYSKRYKARQTTKMKCYGGWHRVKGDSTHRRQRRKSVLVLTKWGYWAAVPEYAVGRWLDPFL